VNRSSDLAHVRIKRGSLAHILHGWYRRRTNALVFVRDNLQPVATPADQDYEVNQTAKHFFDTIRD
jgi:hypothetical protein